MASLTSNKEGNVIQVSFMDEIRQQPDALRRFVELAFTETELQDSLKYLMKSKKNPHVVLTGMGSSLFVCYIAMRILQEKGILASTIESYELQAMDSHFFTEDVIVVAVSQSGESPEVLELIYKLPQNIPVIAVTNYPKSHLYTMTPMAGGIYAGTEYLTSTKSYTNSLAAILLLAYRLAGCCDGDMAWLHQQLEQCAGKMEALIADERIGTEIANFITDIKFIVFVGSGYSYTTACHSEIVAEEAGKFHSSCFTPAQFIHGPIELIYKDFGTVIYDFDRNYSDKCDHVRDSVLEYGGKVLLITNRTDVEERENQMIHVIEHEDPKTATLLEVIPLELGIDSLCKSRGVAAGRISRVVKRMAN